MSKSTFTVPIKKESSGSVIKVIRRQKDKQEPNIPFNPLPVSLQNNQHSKSPTNLVEVGDTKSREETPNVTENKTPNQGSSSSKSEPSINPSRKTLKKPEKPESAFTQFIKKRAPLFEAKGADNGYEQASKCWQKLSPALKNRYEGAYQKAKTKYLSDIVKYDEKVKRIKVKENEKKAKGFTPTFSLPMNKYVSKKQKTAPDPDSVIPKPKPYPDFRHTQLPPAQQMNGFPHTSAQQYGAPANSYALHHADPVSGVQPVHGQPGYPGQQPSQAHVPTARLVELEGGASQPRLSPSGISTSTRRQGRIPTTILVESERVVKSSHVDGVEDMKQEPQDESKGKTVNGGKEEKDDKADFASKPCIDMPSQMLFKSVTVDVTDTLDMSPERPTKSVKVNVTDASQVTSEIPAEAIEAEAIDMNHVAETVMVVDTQRELGKLFVCKICETTFSSVFWFEKHKKNCLPSYQCEQCPKKFKEERSLKRHIKAAHTNGKQCNICGSSFTTENKLKNHIMVIHEAEKVCPKCGKVYKNRKSLWKHMKKFCDENITKEDKTQSKIKRPLVEYDVASDTDSDISDIEAGDANPVKVKSKAKFICVECPKTYNSSRGLRAHKQKHHGKTETNPPNIIEPVVLVVDGQTLGLVENVDIEYVSS